MKPMPARSRSNRAKQGVLTYPGRLGEHPTGLVFVALTTVLLFFCDNLLHSLGKDRIEPGRGIAGFCEELDLRLKRNAPGKQDDKDVRRVLSEVVGDPVLWLSRGGNSKEAVYVFGETDEEASAWSLTFSDNRLLECLPQSERSDLWERKPSRIENRAQAAGASEKPPE